MRLFKRKKRTPVEDLSSKESLTSIIVKNSCVFFLGLSFFFFFFKVNYLKWDKVREETYELKKVYKKNEEKAFVEAVKKVYGTNDLVVFYYDCRNQNDVVEFVGYFLKRKHEFVPEKVRVPKAWEFNYVVHGRDVSNRCGKVLVGIDKTIYKEFQTRVEEAIKNGTPLSYVLVSPLKNYRHKHRFLGPILICFFFIFFSEILILTPIYEISSELEARAMAHEFFKNNAIEAALHFLKEAKKEFDGRRFYERAEELQREAEEHEKKETQYETALSFVRFFEKLLFLVRLVFLVIALVL